MPQVPILAYYFDQEEEALIRKYLNDPTATESFILGTIESGDLAVLRKKGILFDLQVDPSTSSSGMSRNIQTRSLGKRFLSVGTGESDRKLQENYYLIRLKGPLLQPWREELESADIRIVEHLQNQLYKVHTTTDITSLRNLPFVVSARSFESADTEVIVKRSLLTEFDIFEAKDKRIAIYDIKLHIERRGHGEKEGSQEGKSQETLANVLAFLKNNDVDILETGREKVRIRLEGTDLLTELRQMQEVDAIEEYVRPTLHNDMARLIIGLDDDHNGNHQSNTPFEGEGQVVGVADTGIDADHPDFEGRISGIVARGRPDDSSDPNGHGTHVAGSVLGSGQASNGQIKGVAPRAKLFFQSLMDDEGGLGGIPLNLEELFLEAYEAGVRIHNNSWGALAESEYLFNSMEVDQFVYNHKDMLIVISAGNEGSAFQPRNSKPGYVDWLSLGSPATAKNALTVGASRSMRQKGGFSTLTYGQAWPDVFPDDPLNGEHVSGDDQCIAGFSSRGPCGNESRIKPDIVAPGSDIASTKSSLAPGSNFWGPYPGNRMYAFMGGTSMSAPIVAGYAALIREYFEKEKSCLPSAALLKAAIINGTHMLSGEDALADHPRIPNFHQGFGCIDLINTLPNDRHPDFRLDYVDSWRTPELQFNTTGQRFLFRVNVEEGVPLRLALTWTDPPGRGLQNNLNLFMMHKEKEYKWAGNEDIPRTITAFDRDNNVEIIRIDDPNAGEYVIAVQAANVIFSPQDFALVVTGNLTSNLEKQ